MVEELGVSDVVFPPASSVLRSRDYNSLAVELKHTDGCSHVMPGPSRSATWGMSGDVSHFELMNFLVMCILH